MRWSRLRSDFPLAIITLLGACAAFGIFPFAIYRFVSGQPLAGLVDSAIVLSIVGAVVHAWRSGRTGGAAWFIVATATLGCLAIAILLGLPGLFWMYVLVLANFMLIRPGPAALVTGLAMAVVAVHGKAFDSTFDSTFEMLSFLISASVVALFAAIFSWRTEQQRCQLQRLASHDPLTGVGNRRSMEEELPLAVETSRRERRPCGLAILDLDHFKRINDRHGHAEGDRVLVDFVRLIRAATRKVDRLFRYGGEEFVLLLPGADSAVLHPLVENLRLRIDASLQSRGEMVTVSIGAAALQPDEPWEAWLARADAALYRAKRDGRNRSVVAGESDAAHDGPDTAQATVIPGVD